MLSCFTTTSSKAIPVTPVTKQDYSQFLEKQSPAIQSWLKNTDFKAEANTFSLISDAEGKLIQIILGVKAHDDIWSFGNCAYNLPLGDYTVDENFIAAATLGWGLGAYRFTRYKKLDREPAKLLIKESQETQRILTLLEASYLIRDLINTPTDDMGPNSLAKVAKELAQQYSAEFKQLTGKELETNFPLIYAVGRASDEEPCLVDIRWGEANHPKLTLVGKGVCFDSGGLDIKDACNMLLMKKDMGGAAHVLGLAKLIMQERLPIQLRVLIPAVENVISGNSFHPGDVYKAKNNITVEIGNTDAEGRLVLADAIVEAVNDEPELIIDFATLTGAARVALGPDIPVFCTNRKEIAAEVMQAAERQQEYMWELPLHQPYRDYLKSNIADINNAALNGYAGAITAALFLERFVNNKPWLHIDLMAWNVSDRPGRPQGGEAMGLRTILEFIKRRMLD